MDEAEAWSEKALEHALLWDHKNRIVQCAMVLAYQFHLATLKNDLAKARALLHAVMVTQFLPGIDNIDKAVVFTYIAVYNSAAGDLRAAERYAQSAIRLVEDNASGRRTHAKALLALADVRVRQEQPEQALDLLTEARQVVEDAFGPDHYLVVDAVQAGIPVLQSLGRKEEAQRFEQLIAERNKRVQRLVQDATLDDE